MPTPQVQTIGQLIVKDILPADVQSDRVLDKKGVTDLFDDLARRYPDQYVDILHRLNSFSEDAATTYGEGSSIRLSDLRLPPAVKAYRASLKKRIHGITQSDISMEQKNAKLVDLMRNSVSEIQSRVLDESYGRGNTFAQTAKHGIKGNPGQLSQILFGDIMVTDHKGRPIAVPGVHGYGEGVPLSEYWAGSYAARAGSAAVQFATADTGYLGKQLAMLANRVRVTGEDCGASGVGVTTSGDDAENLGRVLADDIGNIKSGTVIDKEHLSVLSGREILTRSLLTCQQEDGVCSKCAGKQYDGKFPEAGEFIGIRAARAVAEPLVQQIGLSAKHTGTTVGAEKKDISGFPEINRFLQVPERFASASVLASASGKVTRIMDAPQGGKYILVGDKQLHAPPGRDVIVKEGESVEAGDMLTDGTPNPVEVAGYKGLGEGRRYFTEKFNEILRGNNVKSHRSNIEVLGKAFFDRVRINSDEGFGDYTRGDIVPYSVIQRSYIPREDSETVKPDRAVGGYLEKPVLHYSIGTPITNKLAGDFQRRGIGEVIINRKPPGFEPAPVRLAGFASQDPDWKTRMAGTGLKKSLLEGVAYGASSPHKTTSYVPGLMNPAKMQ